MDEDADEDTALSNLHHGLDSSFDEDMNGSGKQDMRSVHHSNSLDSHNEEVVTENQINLLQDMVLEMKQGFHAALQELAKIQDKEEADGNHSKQLQQQQQRQLDHMTETIVEIKQQLSSLTRNVEQIMDEQKTLKTRLVEVRPSRDSSQENKMSADRDSNQRPSLLDDNSAHSEEWNSKFSAQLAETGSNRTVNEVTAIACKSLSLTQALGEECQKLGLSQSSNDEEEDQELLRLSRYRRKSGHLVFSQTVDRQHANSGHVGMQDRNKTILNAAQRQKSVMELADSERDYSSQLWSLLRTYLTPLQTAGFLSARELDILFPSYLEQLYAEHCHICTGLQDRLIHWTYTVTVTDLLARFTDSYNSDSLLSLYKEYADDLPAALSCLRRALAHSSEFRLFLKAVQHSSCQSESLMALLLAPIQRLPKFLLQLQEISRHTPATHTDFPHLQSLLHQLQLFVDQLNDDLFHTVQDLNQDKQASRSDFMNGHVLNGRDSGVHSNSTEEDNLISARALFKTRRSYVSSEWLDNPYHGANTRQPWSSSGRASALSQPDLTAYSSMDRMTPDPLPYVHIPRSQSALTTADGDGGNDGAARRQVQKFKIKRRNPSPVGYTSTQDHNQSHLSSRVRPSSAVDFVSHSQHQQYNKYSSNNNNSDVYGGSRNYLYSGPKPRPQSALGQHTLSSSHRPVVISRKNIRRPQPSGPTSNTCWNETKASSAVPVRVGQQITHLAAEDLYPACSTTNRRVDIVDGHDGDEDDDDDDDDTRASDAFSFGTSESRLYTHGHGVNSIHEPGLDLSQGHVSYPTARKSSLVYDTADSNVELVTDDAPRRLYSSKPETRRDDRGIRQGNRDLPKPKSVSVLKYQPSQSVVSQKNNNSDIKGLPMSHSETKDVERPTGSSTHNLRLDQRNTKEQISPDESSLLSDVFYNGDNSVTSVSSSGFNVSQEKDEREPSSKRHFMKTISKSESAVDDRAENRPKHVSETNRQFLLMLSSRTSALGRGDMLAPSSTSNNTGNIDGNVVEISNRSHSLQSNSDTSESLSPEHTSDSRRVLPYVPPRHSKAGNTQRNSVSTIPDTVDHGNTKPTLPPKRHLKHCVSSPAGGKDGSKTSSGIPQSESPLKYDPTSPQTLSSSSTTYPQSPSIHSSNASILSQMSLSLENQHSPNRPTPLFTSSTSGMPVHSSSRPTPVFTSSTASMPAVPPSQPPAHVTSKTNGQNYDDHISYSSSHEPQPLDLTDLDVDGEKGKRRGSIQYKMKDEGSIVSSDTYSMASDDQANVRKKMHFKASLKNLFAKKKGRVVLADIERQVVREMATTAAEGAGATSASVTSPAVTNMTHSGSRHLGNVRGSHPGDIGTSHKTMGEPLVEIKTQKDQGSSTSSPVKMYKKFKFLTKNEKDADSVQRCGQVNPADCEQNQQEKNMLKYLSLRNKRHGIILENPDTELAKILEAGGDSPCSSERDSCSRRHSYIQDRSCSSQSYFLQRPQSEVVACAVFSDGIRSHSKSGDKRLLLEHVQHQADLRNVMEVRKATSCEPDLLQFAPGYKNNKYKTVHGTCQDKGVSSSSASENEQNPSGHRHREHDMKKSQLSGFDLCQQCQKNELRHMETIDGADNKNTFSRCEGQVCAVEMAEKVSNDARKYASIVVPECRTLGDVSCTVGQTSSQQSCVLNGVRDPRTAEKIKQFSYIDDPSISSNADCADNKLEDETCRNTNLYPLPCYVQRLKKEKLGDRSRFGTLSPVYEQPSPVSSHAAQSMPDVAKCSTLVASWFDQSTMLSSSTAQESSPAPSLICTTAGFDQTHGSEFSKTLDTKSSSASAEFVTSMQVSSSLFHVSPSHNKMSPSAMLDHCISDSQTLAPSEIILDQAGETIIHNQLPTAVKVVLPQCDPHVDSCRNPATAEGDSEILVKCSSLEDRESFEHRYRLYYDDETDASKLQNMLENPKSLKALSASCVIREHFRQSPWNETSSCFKNHQASDQQLPLLTLEVPLMNSADRCQQMPNSATRSGGCPNGKKVAVYIPRHLPHTSESSCAGLGTAVLNMCRSHTSPQLSVCSPLTDGLSLHNPTDHTNNDTSTNPSDSIAASHKNKPPMTSKRHQEVILKLNDSETSLKLPPVSNGCENDAKHVKPIDLDSLQSRAASSAAVDYDESNSYKPRNPRPVSQLSNTIECQTAGYLKRDGCGNEDSPDASRTGVDSHSPGAESQTAVSSSRTTPTSLDHEPLLHSSINQEADEIYNNFHSQIQADQTPPCAESCTARRSWSFNKARENSSIEASTEASARAVSPVVYFCKQSGDDPFLQEGCTFLRTSSPYDPTILRTSWPKKSTAAPSYKDNNTLSANNSTSTTPISSETDRNNTKDVTKSLSKEVSAEKEDKCPRHPAYGRMKATFDEDNNHHKECKKLVTTDSSSSVPGSSHSSNTRRHRHSNSAKFRCQEQQFYLSQNPRYSVDSNPLIQTAFLQKMACLPEYMIKQGGNLQVDDKTPYTMKATSRHAKMHFDVTRKSYGPIDGKSRTARNNPSSKPSSLSSTSPEVPEADLGLPSYENHQQRANTRSTGPATAQASPDLLPSREPSREDAHAKDKTSTCKKAQSFFSKLTNSPMSFFYKESKPSNPPN